MTFACVLAACAHAAPRASDDPTTWARCEQFRDAQLAACTGVLDARTYVNRGWALRADYDQVAGSCPVHAEHGAFAELGRCVDEIEERERMFDPQAKTRREAAREKIIWTRRSEEFQQFVREWNRGGEHRAEIEHRLAIFLIARGFDMRDFSALGLWPDSPSWNERPAEIRWLD